MGWHQRIVIQIRNELQDRQGAPHLLWAEFRIPKIHILKLKDDSNHHFSHQALPELLPHSDPAPGSPQEVHLLQAACLIVQLGWNFSEHPGTVSPLNT